VAALGARRPAVEGDGAVAVAAVDPHIAPVAGAPRVEEAGAIVEYDPFRLARHPSPIIFRPELEGVPPAPRPPAPPHPVLALSGILGGPPWEALLDGIPGHDGSVVVRRGQALGPLRIRKITRDSVIVQGEDTTWRLGMKRVWQ
ncbi:MAG TPA: hypothetical protein VLV15_04625, partial [Dongiaceae bacterium]|nr:hypothetical protein [Dongiaceae bacterium]